MCISQKTQEKQQCAAAEITIYYPSWESDTSPNALETDRLLILEESTLRPEKEFLWKDAINILA
jgi:hypothetical protein